MSRNLRGSTLSKQKKDAINRMFNLSEKKSVLTQGQIHSCNYLSAKNNTLDQLVDFLEDESYPGKLNLVTADYISAFSEVKVEDKNCNKTIKNHLSKISSFFTALKRLGYETNITHEEFQALRDEFKNAGHETLSFDRSFENPEKVIESLYCMRLSSGILAELQFTCGYRVHEAFQIKPEHIEFKNNLLTIKKNVIKGKGGFPLHMKLILPELYRKLQLLFEFHGGFDISANQYNKDIQYIAGKTYSSHAFRYNYAQLLYEGFVLSGYTEHEAKLQVSEAMGHHRAEITGCYLGNGGK